jgi:hypothetical protein
MIPGFRNVYSIGMTSLFAVNLIKYKKKGEAL